ncbi:MAG: hypothetical protein AB1430_10100 [Pseudomonadota bacterium]
MAASDTAPYHTGPGDALIDAPTCFGELQALQGDFDIMSFLNLCSGIDAAVLHGSLHTAVATPDLDGIPIARELAREGVLVSCAGFLDLYDRDVRVQTFADPKAQELTGLMSSFHIEDVAQLDLYMDLYGHLAGQTVALAPYVVLEDRLRVPVVTPASSLSFYLGLSHVQAEQRASRLYANALASRYAEYKTVLKELRASVDGEDRLAIPPIALQILDRAVRPEDVPGLVLEQRHRYAKVRALFAELDETLRSDAVAPLQKLKAKARITKSVRKLFERAELDQISLLTSMAGGLNETVKAEDLIKEAEVSDVAWSKIIGWLIAKGEVEYWKFRLRPLHATKKRYLSIPKAQTAAIVQRLFSHQLSPQDYEFAAMWERLVGKKLQELDLSRADTA